MVSRYRSWVNRSAAPGSAVMMPAATASSRSSTIRTGSSSVASASTLAESWVPATDAASSIRAHGAETRARRPRITSRAAAGTPAAGPPGRR